ncbi:hypothetical protein [Massilia phyllosphaerae]|uniref:hypothetical protein n=1 Tax=Massilia phyllosphaerae TaxID=3106034 RepID=UPI002B1CAE88|nr:hypothetical protein [Massilia sp. SGZ-792]
MKLSIILETLAAARLPSVTSKQLKQLVGTAEGKAFANDLRWYAAGETRRREHLAAVVHALAPGVRRTVEQLGFRFDLSAIIAAAKLDGSAGIDTIKAANANPGNRARVVVYLQGAGLQLMSKGATAAPAPVAPVEPPYYSFKIFGASAALCIAEAITKADRRHTINIEGAVVLAGDSARKVFDWPNKIVVQLTVQEAYQVLALLENKTKSLRFDGHGREHDKSLQMEFQDSHYFFRLIQRGRAAISVPVRPVDAISMVSLLYKQLLLNEPHLRIDDIHSMVERMASMTCR